MSTQKPIGSNAPETAPAVVARKRSLSPKVADIMSDRQGNLPVWVRPPKGVPEYFSGFTRAKLYQLAGEGRIRTAAVREPGSLKGVRLFHLQSILDYIAGCEETTNQLPA